MRSLFADLTKGGSKIFGEKNPESSKKQNLTLLCWQLLASSLHYIYDYLYSIYIVLGIISNLAVI